MAIVTEAPRGASDPRVSGPSVVALRARRLLVGGLAGAHVAAITCVGIFAVLDGAAGMASAALAAAVVILFYTVGQTVQIRFADSSGSALLRASLLSYVARVSVLGGLLVAYFRFADDSSRLLSTPVVVSAVATVVGWLVGEIVIYSRLRIPNFDEPEPGGSGKDA